MNTDVAGKEACFGPSRSGEPIFQKAEGKQNLLYKDCYQSIDQSYNHTCMAIDASGSQATQEKVLAQEDPDSDFQPPIKPAFNYMPFRDTFDCSKKKKKVKCILQ